MGSTWSPWASQEQAEKTLQLSGTFGDTFGMVNALISAVAFGGVLYTIHLQRKELALQREEVRAARREASRSADALNKQVLLSAQSARISGLSDMSQFLDSIITDDDTQEVREARGRRAWHAEQMQFYLSRLLNGELDVERRNDIDFEGIVMELLNKSKTKWDYPCTSFGDPYDEAMIKFNTRLLLDIAEHLGALHYYAHPLSPAFKG